jgi:ElaB/YqjD/DUF883 family membrane-anchored ribosome-binding protein
MTTTSSTSFPTSPGASSTDDHSKSVGTTDSSTLSAEGTSSGEHQQGDVMSRVVQGAHATIDRVADSAAPHVQRLQQGMASASDSLHERSGQAREMGEEWTESLRDTVRANPLAAVAAALVAGLVIARLTDR